MLQQFLCFGIAPIVDFTNVILIYLPFQNSSHPKSSSTDFPRSFATCSGVFKFFNPSIVANTTFCLLLEPKDFERMFLYPASSRTIREGPPAMIPVPSGDVFNNTDAPPKFPVKSCGVVPFHRLVLSTRLFIAASFPLRIASEFQLLFPNPAPT